MEPYDELPSKTKMSDKGSPVSPPLPRKPWLLWALFPLLIGIAFWMGSRTIPSPNDPTTMDTPSPVASPEDEVKVGPEGWLVISHQGTLRELLLKIQSLVSFSVEWDNKNPVLVTALEKETTFVGEMQSLPLLYQLATLSDLKLEIQEDEVGVVLAVRFRSKTP